jgi:putative flippase GtrA
VHEVVAALVILGLVVVGAGALWGVVPFLAGLGRLIGLLLSPFAGIVLLAELVRLLHH